MSQVDFNKLESAHARLGEAVIDPAQWPALMEAISEATHTAGAALLRSDVQSPDVPMTGSVVEVFTKYFDENLHLTDARAARSVPLLLQNQRVLSDQDIFASEAEMLRTPLYAHLNRFKFRWFSAVPFRSGEALWVISLQRQIHEGMFDSEEMNALAHLCAPLTEVAMLSRLVGHQVLLGTLNAMALINQPALSLTSRGTVLETNALADSIFDSEFGVRHGALFMNDHEASRAIQAIVSKRLISSEMALPQPREPDEVIVVRRTNKKPILIRVLPVHGAARSPFLGARFILTLRDLENERPLPGGVLAQLYSLTPMETKVAVLIARGYSPEEIAEMLQNSRETVRNQIKAVFAKTGTHRQNELAALILRMQA